MTKYLILLLLFLMPTKAVAQEYEITSIDGTYTLRTEKYAEIIGDINSETAVIFSMRLINTMAIEGDRLIIIDSGGGYTEPSNNMLNSIDGEKRSGVKIVCVVTNTASSMAFNILSRCDVRAAVVKSHLMFHNLSYGSVLESENIRLTAKVLRNMADRLDRDDTSFKPLNMSLLKISLHDYEMYADEDHIWTADALLKNGYLNYLVTVKKH